MWFLYFLIYILILLFVFAYELVGDDWNYVFSNPVITFSVVFILVFWPYVILAIVTDFESFSENILAQPPEEYQHVVVHSYKEHS